MHFGAATLLTLTFTVHTIYNQQEKNSLATLCPSDYLNVP